MQRNPQQPDLLLQREYRTHKLDTGLLQFGTARQRLGQGSAAGDDLEVGILDLDRDRTAADARTFAIAPDVVEYRRHALFDIPQQIVETLEQVLAVGLHRLAQHLGVGGGEIGRRQGVDELAVDDRVGRRDILEVELQAAAGTDRGGREAAVLFLEDFERIQPDSAGIGGRGGNSGNGNLGGRPLCGTGTDVTTGVGGTGAGGAGSAAASSNVTTISTSLQPGGAGTSSSITGTAVEYGTGGSGGGGEGGGPVGLIGRPLLCGKRGVGLAFVANAASYLPFYVILYVITLADRPSRPSADTGIIADVIGIQWVTVGIAIAASTAMALLLARGGLADVQVTK